MTTTTIDRQFAEHLLQTFDDPGKNGVHMLFNQFWAYCPPEVAQAYADQFESDPALKAFVDEGHYADSMTLADLAACPAGSLGEACHEFIADNGLEANLALNYRQFHSMLENSGTLDGMPEPLRFAVIRGFQLHDFLHVVTGYGPTPRGEIGLQAFCLAQLQFPYFAMWISVVTTRMALIDPASIVGLMDAITEGWQYGRSVPNPQLERWEELIHEPLSELRIRYGIDAEARTRIVDLALTGDQSLT